MEFSGKRITPNITLCEDGKYRWRYDVGLFKNFDIFRLVWKVLFFPFLGIFGIVFFADLLHFGFEKETIKNNALFLCYVLIGITVLSLIGYLLYAAIMGGSYCIIFEMDESGINHKQLPSQAKKAKKLARTTVAAGAAAGSLSAMGVGAGAARTEMYTAFSRVKKVKYAPKKHVIYLHCTLSHNRVYVAEPDYCFVQQFIASRTRQAKSNIS